MPNLPTYLYPYIYSCSCLLQNLGTDYLHDYSPSMNTQIMQASAVLVLVYPLSLEPRASLEELLVRCIVHASEHSEEFMLYSYSYPTLDSITSILVQLPSRSSKRARQAERSLRISEGSRLDLT